MPNQESDKKFESRKADHVRLSMDPGNQTTNLSGLSRVRLIHEALPDINWTDLTIESSLFGEKTLSPIFVSSMTAGHAEGEKLNFRIAEAAEKRGWVMGIGSQRKQLFDAEAVKEWARFRGRFPELKIMGNIGLSQLIEMSNDDVLDLVDSVKASAMIIHTNPLQEALQPEGTPRFRGGFKRLEDLAKNTQVPIVLKEVGCGFSKRTLLKLKGIGLKAVDVSGLGGTHWGRIEGKRATNEVLAQTAESFKDWGISTIDSLRSAIDIKPDYEVWASGGVRSGLDAAKLFALGAKMVGIAQPVMLAASESTKAVEELLARIEYELKLSLFCTGSRSVLELRNHIEVREAAGEQRT
jgi:isopentenyl-diphosphate Delta-isomerase